MLKSLIITAIIIIGNILFFFYGGQEIVNEQSYRNKEVLNALYKFLIYAGPVIVSIIVRDRSNVKKSLGKRLRWFSQKWVYGVWLGWFVFLLITKNTATINFGVYGFFYVLFVNSFIEESVFRLYIQKKLIGSYGRIKGIIGQAILFGAVHIPFYYSKYSTGSGTTILVVALISPIILGIIWGSITEKTKSLRPSIVLHSIHNGVLLFL